MFSFSPLAHPPAITSHLDTQMAFFADFSQKMIDGFQKINALNVQVAKTLLNESAATSRQLLSLKNQSEALSMIAGQSQPALGKMRAYQAHVRQICADTQADVTKSFQAYMPELTRAAEAVVKDVSQKAVEHARTASQAQQDVVEKATAATVRGLERVTESAVGKTVSS